MPPICKPESCFELLAERTDTVDKLFSGLLSQVDTPLQKKMVLVATGGYGRKELNLHSDIDVMLLYEGVPKATLEALVQKTFYPLWDQGYTIQSTIRTLRDCKMMLHADLRSRTALLEHRWVWGDQALYQKFVAHLQKHWSKKRNRRQFFKEKFAEMEARHFRFAETVFLLEPQLKEGMGGLRDVHLLQWLQLACGLKEALFPFTAAEGVRLKAAVQFLLYLREALHQKTGRKNDLLTFALQEAIAYDLGWTDAAHQTAPQRLMQVYYRHANTIANLVQAGLRRFKERYFSPWWRLFLTEKRVFDDVSLPRLQAPYQQLEILQKAACKDWPLSEKIQIALWESRHAITPAVWQEERVITFWQKLFTQPAVTFRVLRFLHNLECLHLWFPELAHLIYYAPRDAYHTFTVDVHTLRTIRAIGRLEEGGKRDYPEFAGVLGRLSNPRLLTLSLFLHDAGKGLGKMDHPTESETIAATILQKMQIPAEEQETILYLVRSHLVMSKVAFLRDVNDDHLIEQFASEVESPERLALLYLMTFADLRAVAPKVLTDWKRSLMNMLYQRTLQFWSKVEQTPADVKRRRVEKRHEVLHNFPLGYFQRYTEEECEAHGQLLSAFLSKDLLFSLVNKAAQDNTHSVITFVAPDAPGLFSSLSGVLSVNRMTILEADLYTTKNHVALDMLRVVDAGGGPVQDLTRWKRVERDLTAVLRGKLVLAELVAKARSSILAPKIKTLAIAKEVLLDNDVSASHTVLEIHTADRLGLLHDVTRLLFESGLSIDRAKIATEGQKVIDVFYVTEATGQKLEDKEEWKQIQERLMQVL